MMELKNYKPKTEEDFMIAMMLDSCEEVFEEVSTPDTWPKVSAVISDEDVTAA